MSRIEHMSELTDDARWLYQQMLNLEPAETVTLVDEDRGIDVYIAHRHDNYMIAVLSSESKRVIGSKKVSLDDAHIVATLLTCGSNFKRETERDD